MKAVFKLVVALLLTVTMYAGDPFVITVKTDNPGPSDNNEFTIPDPSVPGVEYKVDCESDGHYEKVLVHGATTCTYAAAGTYRISIDGTFKRLYFNNSGDKEKLLMVNQWGDIAWTSMKRAFYGAVNMELNSSAPAPDLSAVTSMERMFASASSFNTNINHWDVSHVTNMKYLFFHAEAFNGSISDWDVYSVTTMMGMFNRAYAFNQDLNNWDTSNVLDMSGMFQDASQFQGDIGDWNVSKVGLMGGMFINATQFDSNISGWNVASVDDMQWMFNGATQFNQDIGDWNVSNVKYMNKMFEGAEHFNQDIGTWNTSSLQRAENMFKGAFRFNQDIGDWNLSKVTNTSAMFQNAYAFDQNISAWDLSKDTNMTRMFQEARVFNQDLGDWNVSKVTDMSYMFADMLYFNQDLGDWNVSSVTVMNAMFLNAQKFNQDLSTWDVSHVTTMTDMFLNAALSISHYDSLLIFWEKLDLQDNIEITVDKGKYCDGEDARNNIVTNKSWIFNDVGLSCDYHITSDVELLVEHNQSAVTTVSVSHDFYDPNFTIVGGADADKFDINASTGALSFKIAPDYYHPNDSNKDNIYRVQVHYEVVPSGSSPESKDHQTFHVKVVEDTFDASIVPIINYLLF